METDDKGLVEATEYQCRWCGEMIITRAFKQDQKLRTCPSCMPQEMVIKRLNDLMVEIQDRIVYACQKHQTTTMNALTREFSEVIMAEQKEGVTRTKSELIDLIVVALRLHTNMG